MTPTTDDDPIGELAHDHADLNQRVLELGALVEGRRGTGAGSLEDALAGLREQLFLHFAREEEGLFPFVSEQFPELVDRVHAMAFAHDAICGAVDRMSHLAATGAGAPALRALYERFASGYADHSTMEAELLRNLVGRLDPEQRERLASLVRDV